MADPDYETEATEPEDDDEAVEREDIKPGDDVPAQLKGWWRMDRDKAEDWYNDAREDFDFPAGRQYSDDDLETLKKKKRPAIVFDRTSPILDAVAGFEVGNRRDTQYLPRTEGDVKANEIYTEGARWFNDVSHGDQVKSAMFRDMLICGMGWGETRIDFTESPQGEPRKDHIDPFEMAWDRNARQRNLSDATRVWRARRVPLEDAQSMFPGYSFAELNATWSNINSEADLKRDEATGALTGAQNFVTIVQCQYITRKVMYLAQDPMTGQETDFTEAEYTTLNKRMKKLGMGEIQGLRYRKKVIKQGFFGSVVLSYGDAPCPDEFSIQCVTGKYDRNKGTWYGLVRAMKDPQRWANKWLSQMMFIMNSNSKGGLLIEKGATDNPRELEKKWAEADAVTVVNDGALARGAIKEKQITQFPVGFERLTEFAVLSIREVSGVSQELMGTRANDQPIGLEVQRKQAGLNILQWAFDGMKFYAEREGKVVLYYLKNDLSDGRLIRVVGTEEQKYVPLLKQADIEYDIIVDDAPTSPNQKEQIWGVLQGFMPLVGKVIPPEFILGALKYSPLPSTVVAKLEEMAKADTPQKQQKAAEAARAAAAVIDKTASEALLNKAKAKQALTPQQAKQDNSAADSMQRWRETIFNGLVKIEVAKIGAKSQNDSDALDAQIETMLGLSGLASDHAMQMRELAHNHAMQQMQIDNQPPAQQAA